MAYNETLASRVRQAIANLPAVEEKKMFGGLAFIIGQKMTITVGENRIMCRVDPALHDELIKKPGCTMVIMGGKNYKGYVHVNADHLSTDADLNYWIGLALDYNKVAPASKTKRR